MNREMIVHSTDFEAVTIHSLVPSTLAAKGKGKMRRRHQNGELWQDGGLWKCRYYEYEIDPQTGMERARRRQVILGTVKEATKPMAKRLLADLLAVINIANHKPLMTVAFAAFAEKWKREIMCHHKASTQQWAGTLIDKHMVPYFGAMTMKEIRLEVIQRYVNGWTLSGKYLGDIITLMMGMWDMAIAWDYVSHNPFPRGVTGKLLLKMPKRQKPKTYAFTPEETMGIIAKAPGRWKLLFRLAAESGMRSGELAGLRRFDLKGNIITVSQSAWQQKIQTPKSENAYRPICISEALADDLRAYMIETLAEPNPFGLMWTNTRGKPLRMNSVYRLVLDPILTVLGIRAKLDRLGVKGGCYAFRRMNATLMDGLSTPLKTRQARFGHADPSMILTHYSKAVDADNLAAAEQIGALLSSRGEKEAVQ